MSSSGSQEELENKLINRFLKNMEFLNNQNLELYLQVEGLSQLINSGEYKERYILEYIKEDDSFDVYDDIEKKYIYNKEAKNINKALVDRIKLDDKNLILYFEDELLKEFDCKKDIEYLKQNSEDNKTELLMQFLNRYIKVLNTTKSINPNKIEKFVFFGTLLGGHIEKIAKKMDSYTYLVCEDSLEIFRLSLFTADYSILAQRGKLIFSIAKDDFKEDIKDFLVTDFVHNSIIKFSSTYSNTQKYQNEFLSTLIAQRSTSYDFSRILYTSLRNSTKKWRSDYKKLLYKQMQKNFVFFDNKPILYIAGGPSFGDNIDWIQKNQDRFIIATIGSTYASLIKNSIRVDFIFTLDGMYEFLNKTQFSPENISLISDEIIFASSITDDKILDRFKQDRLFVYETSSYLSKENFDISVASVGEMGLALLLLMNAKEIYLLGLDMALNQKTGLSHSVDVNSGIKENNLEDEKLGLNTSIDANVLLEVKGNMQKKVTTNSIYKSSLDYTNKIIKDFSKNCNIYNLGKHGAYFENTSSLDIKNIAITMFDKIEFNKELFINDLTKYTIISLDDDVMIKIAKEIEYLKDIEENYLKLFKKYKIKNIDRFIQENSEFFSKLMIEKDYVHSSIFSNYFDIVLNYLTLIFNNKNLNNEKEKLKQIKTIMYEDIQMLIKDIVKYLEYIK